MKLSIEQYLHEMGEDHAMNARLPATNVSFQRIRCVDRKANSSGALQKIVKANKILIAVLSEFLRFVGFTVVISTIVLFPFISKHAKCFCAPQLKLL